MSKAKLEALVYQAILILIAVLLVSSTYIWPKANEALRGFGLPRPLIIGIGVFIFLSRIGTALKYAVLLNMPGNYRPIPAQPQNLPNLDFDRLIEWSRELESMGFVQLTDYCVEDEVAKLPPGFARLFADPRRGLFAEVNQVFAPNVKCPMACVIMTAFDDGWALSTTNRKPSGSSYVLRRPKGVWSLHPGSAPTELLSNHLQWRQAMEMEVGIRSLSDTSAESYFARDRGSTAEQRAIWRRKIIWVALAEMVLANVSPKREWKGDWPRIMARRGIS